MTRRTEIATRLEAVTDFADPSVALEQYRTPPELAAHLCHRAALNGDLERRVIDLGCGTGMLAIGAVLYGAPDVLGIDVDASALQQARDNEQTVTDDRAIEWLRADATAPPLCLGDATVLANPPFGAQYGDRHADRGFLATASSVSRVSYTVHNAGSRNFVESFVADDGGTVTAAFGSTIGVDRRFEFHDRERSDIPVEIYRIEWG